MHFLCVIKESFVIEINQIKQTMKLIIFQGTTYLPSRIPCKYADIYVSELILKS